MTSNKPHRFDKFARRMAASMLEAIRTTLGVFTSPDKDRWPAAKLLDYLKSAEEMARGMLREIAGKITILPGKARERAGPMPMPPQPSPERAPYFRLGVAREDTPIGVWVDEDWPNRMLLEPRAQRARRARATRRRSMPGDAVRRGNGMRAILITRLQALDDVLAHPGKHAARMARALYRAAHKAGGRLIARSPDDMLLDRVNAAIAAHLSGEGAEVSRLHRLVLEPG